MVKFAGFSTKIIAATVAAVVLNSCHAKIDLDGGTDGNGNVTTETRKVENFTKIDVESGLSVTVEESNTFFVEVEADDNLQELITTKVEDGTLFITTEESIDEATAKNIHIKMPKLTSVEASSGSSVKSNGVITGTEFYVKASSGSEADLDLEVDNISAKSSSGSSVSLKGKALTLSTDSSSGSGIYAKELLVNDVDSEASSGSTTDVHPIVNLKGKASSGSSINYNSDPKTVTKEESSGGSVSKE